MRTNTISRIRGVTIKVGVKTAFLKILMNEAKLTMLSVANFDAKQDSAADYRRCLDPLYSNLANLIKELPVHQRPTIYREGTGKIVASELSNLSFELLHAAGYVKVHFSARVGNKVQTVVLVLQPEGREPVVPALLRAGKTKPEAPQIF